MILWATISLFTMRRQLVHVVSRRSNVFQQHRGFLASNRLSCQHEFKAETSKLLDIVTNSIYTDKEVFLRELLSNASDACEKFRHAGVAGETLLNPDRKLEIKITTEPETLTIEDSGIGMTKVDLMENLGTIAKSGSKAFVESAKNSTAAQNVIGKFGVGFYSAFMVGSEIDVFSASAVDGTSHVWSSTGTDSFTLREAPEFEGPGTKIVIKLKESERAKYSNASDVSDIVTKFSNFVGFPISVNEKVANTNTALWTRSPSEVTDEEYNEFFKLSGYGYETPLFRLHLKTDVPIDLKSILFIPKTHTERLGMERMEPGVSLYSRKVLVDRNSKTLLPSWLRFVKGVVDSQDLPINLARENMQDSSLLQNISKVMSRRILKLLKDQAKKDPKQYNDVFYHEYSRFLKEGVCTDINSIAELGKLLRFNSSFVADKEVISFDEYIARCPPTQQSIYYIRAPSRSLAVNSPYYEIFKKRGIEVLFLYNEIDEFVMGNMRNYEGRTFVAAEAKNLNLGEEEKTKEEEKTDDNPTLNEEDAKQTSEWMLETLSDVVSRVTETTRLDKSPALIVDHESSSVRRMMAMLQQDNTSDIPLPKQNLEINIKHPLILKLNDLRTTDPELASALARQIYDNTLIAAGLVEDARSVLPGFNSLLEKLLAKR